MNKIKLVLLIPLISIILSFIVVKSDVPFYYQEYSKWCFPACLQMLFDGEQKEWMAKIKGKPWQQCTKMSCSKKEIKSILWELGSLRFEDGVYRNKYDLSDDLTTGPIIVCIPSSLGIGHCIILVKSITSLGKVSLVINDPSKGCFECNANGFFGLFAYFRSY